MKAKVHSKYRHVNKIPLRRESVMIHTFESKFYIVYSPSQGPRTFYSLPIQRCFIKIIKDMSVCAKTMSDLVVHGIQL